MATRWPGYFENELPQRTYAMDLGDKILTEHGESIPYTSWEDVKQCLHSLDLILLAPDLFRFLDMGAVKDPKCKILAGTSGGVRYIGSREGQSTRAIVPSDVWGDSTIGMMKRLRALSLHCGVGDRSTPSAMGIALMRSVWKSEMIPWHRAAPMQLQKTLSRESPSPRTETPGEGWHGDAAWEYDLTSAFATHFREHPTGRVVSIDVDDHDWFEDMGTWFRACYVDHPKTGFTCVPQRLNGQWLYSHHPMKRVVWLWREQAEAARAIGCRILPGEGWGWIHMTQDNSRVVDRMMQLKATAPDRILPMIKASIVASIGRHAMQEDDWDVIDHFTEEGECKPIARFTRPHGDSPFTDYYLLLRKKTKGGMIHWQRYTVMRTNQTLFDLASIHQHNLLMTNFDSVTLRERLPVPMPGWKEINLSRVSIPYSRAIMSLEKTRTPGRVMPIHLP